ncbi:peptidoglycan DD-metalloendopeptidase family protein [Taklimakanibacter lacteus]|uniref:peptidoglycan DD-metalloendopeptidase family protein n=1 Tax=Taklimakanibacter lacteus TaxID=2268456 RepID=UPI000E675313
MRSSSVRAVGIPSKASLLLSVAAAVLLSACSGSVDRFADTSSSSSEDTIYTASVPKNVQRSGDDQDVASAASDRDTVTRRPMANNTSKAAENYASNGYNYQQTYKPVYKQTGGYQQPSYQANNSQPAGAEPSYNDQPDMAAKSGSVRIEPGMTLYSIARANNMTVGELARANNLAAPYSVAVGQTLRVPGRGNAIAPQPVAYAKPDNTLTPGGDHTVRAGETLYSLGRTYGVSPFAIAKLNGLSNNAALRQGQSVRIPKGGTGGSPVVASNIKQPDRMPAANDTTADADSGDQIDQPATDMAQAQPKPVQQPPQQMVDTQQPAQEAGSLAFRWPVKGRVISGYGSKPGGLRNEGINIAVPEGTDVRAAEAGVVAYAGNELKGYGNLVLIRHEGGWVTAYAHNKDLFVKRGDTVKRGDVISKAGQTGSVSSPQVHFEVRKGATAMDPMRFLNAATASN